MTSIKDFAVFEQDYAQFIEEAMPFLCPQCHHRRWRHGGHRRWVCWAPGQWHQLTLMHVRCPTCHTVETLFPPWLLPYESFTVDVVHDILTAVGQDGVSVTQVAQQWAVPIITIQRRIQRWLPVAPTLRQRVVQQADQWGIGMTWSTWQPSATTRSADWSWLLVAWHALALVLMSAGILRVITPGLVHWRYWAPEALPRDIVPRRAHLGRRLLAGAGPPLGISHKR